MSEPARLIAADPPWPFEDSLPGKKRGAAKNYELLSVEDIRRYPLPSIAIDAMLLLWRVSSMVEEAYSVVRAWGFVPKSEIVWIKTTTGGKAAFGMGRYVRGAHETCIVAARGKASALIRDRGVRSFFIAPVREHSRKPDEFYAIAERLFPGPRVELFARGTPCPGWESYGREAWGVPEAPSR